MKNWIKKIGRVSAVILCGLLFLYILITLLNTKDKCLQYLSMSPLILMVILAYVFLRPNDVILKEPKKERRYLEQLTCFNLT